MAILRVGIRNANPSVEALGDDQSDNPSIEALLGGSAPQAPLPSHIQFRSPGAGLCNARELVSDKQKSYDNINSEIDSRSFFAATCLQLHTTFCEIDVVVFLCNNISTLDII